MILRHLPVVPALLDFHHLLKQVVQVQARLVARIRVKPALPTASPAHALRLGVVRAQAVYQRLDSAPASLLMFK